MQRVTSPEIGCARGWKYLSRMTALTMVFELSRSASKMWRRMDAHQLAKIVRGVKFKPAFATSAIGATEVITPP